MKNSLMAKWAEAVVAIFSVLILGWLDYLLGYEMSFFVFYFVPIALVASRFGAKGAYTLSILCAATWFACDKLSGHHYANLFYEYWNTLVRLAAFLVIVNMVSRICVLLASSRQELTKLQGILPICSKCKKIRDDKGSWHQIEAYISQHSDVQFSHGLCNKCYEEAIREIKTIEGTD